MEDEIQCIESDENNDAVFGILGFLEQNPHIGQTKVFSCSIVCFHDFL